MDATAVAETLAQGFEASWNAHDMAAFGDLFDADASFVNRYGMIWVGQPSVVEGHRFIHEGVYRDTTIANTVVRAETIAPGVMLMHMLSRMTIGPSMPHGPRNLNTLMLVVATERDGTWRIRSAENVAITDPMSDQPVLEWPHPLSPVA